MPAVTGSLVSCLAMAQAARIAPVMRPVTSSGELSRMGLSATLWPRRRTTMRSATPKTSGMRWLISTTAMPCSRNRRRRSSTSATCRTLIAAVGSSISTILARDKVRACDGDGLALAAGHHAHLLGRERLGFQLGKQLARTLVHGAVVEDAERAEAPHLLARQEDVGRCRQVVAKGEVLIDDLDAGSARIDRLVEMDRPAFQQHVAGRRRKLPAMILTSVDLPAPLSPMSPTISPQSSAKSTCDKASMAPKCLEIP